MNIYEKIIQQITPYLPEVGTRIGEFVFLSPNTLWYGESKERPFVAVAEDRWAYGEGLFLAVTEEGPVYIADLNNQQFLNYCTASFPQFIEIMKCFQEVLKTHVSPDVWDEEGFHRCEEEEERLRQQINQIDPTAIEDTELFWSIVAEELGAGF